MGIFTKITDPINERIADSFVGKFFQIRERGSCFTTELRAGTVTFLTMAYILAVNAAIVADTGGPCSDADCTGANAGKEGCRFADPDGGFGNPGYLQCREEAKRSMATATAVSTFVACWLMGIVANLPFAIAPGMGINAFFTYTVVGFFGDGGMITYKQALAAAFIEGWIFVLISISGARGKIVQAVPRCIMLATAGGIGLFLAFIGLQGSEGIGLITMDGATLVTLGGCNPEERTHAYFIKNVTAITSQYDLPAPSGNYQCSKMKMRSPTTWLGIMGGMLMVILMGRGFRGGIMYAILFVTFISWIPNHKATYFGDSEIGRERFRYFKKVALVPDTSKTDLAMEWNAFGTSQLWAALISFLYLDFLDATGTFFSMANFLNKKMGGRFIDPLTKNFPRAIWAYTVDGTAIWIGALMGIPPLTTYIESATGIREGGRTGITALMVGFYFFLAMFFTPIFASIPPYATGPALILVGAMMMENLLDIEWRNPQEAIPAFLTIALIPLTYSIAYGIIAGMTTYLFLYLAFLIWDLVTAPFSKKPFGPILAAAKPDVFMNEEELIAQEAERRRKHQEYIDEDNLPGTTPTETIQVGKSPV